MGAVHGKSLNPNLCRGVSPKRSILTSVGAEALVAEGGGTAQEPAATVRRWAAGGGNGTGDFGGEALPECGA